MELLLIFVGFGLAALVCLLVRRKVVIELVSVAAALSVLVTSAVVAVNVAASGTYEPFSGFAVDALGTIMMLIIACVGLAATVYSVAYLRRELAKGIIGFTRMRQFFFLLDLFLGVMFLAVTSSSPVVTWLSVEATTLSTAFLISFYNKPSAMEAAWKYLIINSVGLLLGFLGTLLYFTAVHTSQGAG